MLIELRLCYPGFGDQDFELFEVWVSEGLFLSEDVVGVRMSLHTLIDNKWYVIKRLLSLKVYRHSDYRFWEEDKNSSDGTYILDHLLS